MQGLELARRRRFLQGRFVIHIYYGKGDHHDMATFAPAEIALAYKMYDRLSVDTVFCDHCNAFHMTGFSGEMSTAQAISSDPKGSESASKRKVKTNPSRLL